MSRLWSRLRGRPCSHERTTQFESVGVIRRVCESCGHISFAMQTESQTPQRNPERSKLPRAS